jgi:hypothetical protein
MTKVQVPRLEEIQDLSDKYNDDPFSASVRVRKRFREQKKIDKAKKAIDDGIKGRYGLPEELKLLEEGDEDRISAKEEWDKAKREREGAKRSGPTAGFPSIYQETPTRALPIHASPHARDGTEDQRNERQTTNPDPSREERRTCSSFLLPLSPNSNPRRQYALAAWDLPSGQRNNNLILDS